MKLRASLAVLCGLLWYMATPAYAQTPFTGTIQVTFYISTATAVPSGDSITCDVTATVSDNNAATSYTEDAFVTATVSSPTSAYCVVTIPYIWNLATQSTDSITVSYTIAYVPSSTSTNFNTRSTASTLASQPVPADGGSVVIPATGGTTVRL
jgi:hypothetical protein